MTYISAAAVFLIIWWIVLFAVLPFGLKTQDDDGETVLGTVSSAPRGPHMLRAVIWTTIVSLVIFGFLALLTRYFGLSIDDIMRVFPDFK
jgi:predicted secreted protein